MAPNNSRYFSVNCISVTSDMNIELLYKCHCMISSKRKLLLFQNSSWLLGKGLYILRAIVKILFPNPVSIVSVTVAGSGLMPIYTEPLPKPMLTHHQKKHVKMKWRILISLWCWSFKRQPCLCTNIEPKIVRHFALCIRQFIFVHPRLI